MLNCTSDNSYLPFVLYACDAILFSYQIIRNYAYNYLNNNDSGNRPPLNSEEMTVARDHFFLVALINASGPPTIGSVMLVAFRSMVSSVPGFGQTVNSLSLEKIMRPIF